VKSWKRKMFWKERSLKKTRGSGEIGEAKNVSEGMKPLKRHGAKQKRGNTNESIPE
jgi:hypothetical protein